MKNAIILILLSISYFACAQKNQVRTNQASIDPIQEHENYIKQATAFIEVVNKNKSLLLSDKVDNMEVFSCLDQLKQGTLTFTKSELAFIISQSTNPPIKNGLRNWHLLQK